MKNTHIKNKETTVTSNSETATVAASTDNTMTVVTSPSGETNNSAFQPFEQLHEAVLAAVNSNSMPAGFMAAAAAAAAAVASPSNNQPEPVLAPLPPPPKVDYGKKAGVRASNRERKKKWRIHNEERNKDNDLRCRVNKRANKVYGAQDSPAKQQWVQEEFEKRRQKRMDKERRKHIVNNVLSVPTDSNTTTTNANIQLANYYQPLPEMDQEALNKIVEFPTDLHRQLLEQLNNSMLALTGGNGDDSSVSIQQSSNEEGEKSTTAEEIQQVLSTSNIELVKHVKQEEGENQDKEQGNKEGKKPEYPMDAVLTLMQLNAGWRQ